MKKVTGPRATLEGGALLGSSVVGVLAPLALVSSVHYAKIRRHLVRVMDNTVKPIRCTVKTHELIVIGAAVPIFCY